MPVIQGRPRRFRQRRNLVPATCTTKQPDDESLQVSPLASFTTLQQVLPHSKDDLSDACSVAGSETSLDLDSESDSDSDDSSDNSSDDDSENDSDVDVQEEAGLGLSNLQRISQYEETGPVLANRGRSAEKMMHAEQMKWIK